MSSVDENTCTEQGRSIPDGWVETTLGEAGLEVLNGFAFKSKNFLNEECENVLPVLKIKNVANGDANHNDIVYHKFSDSLEKYRITKGDTLIALTGNHPFAKTQVVGGVSKYRLNKDSLLNQRVAKIFSKPNSNLDYEIIYYYFKWRVTKFYIGNQSSGSASQANISKTDLLNIPINLPPLTEQKAIANILTAFDDKIENLQAQNQTLEQTAQNIFKEWFGKYQVGDDLPDGWRVGKLGEVTKSVGGTTPSTKNEDFWNGNIFWSSPKDLSNNEYIYILSTEKKITENGLKKISSGLLPKNTLLLSSRAPVGYLALTNVELAINQGYIAILPNQYFSNYYTFLWLKKSMKKVINAANGSTFLEISKSAFRIIDCVIPEKSKIEDFDKIVAPFFKKTLSNQIQIQTLKKTRDTLLPKLMSGQLRVNEFKS